jgi:hypothetical protein
MARENILKLAAETEKSRRGEKTEQTSDPSPGSLLPDVAPALARPN